jgi:hypothetical protein
MVLCKSEAVARLENLYAKRTACAINIHINPPMHKFFNKRV